jgi:hypothetical protein
MYYLLQYTKALQSIELPKKPAALSHTNSVAVAANAQCNNKKQSSVRSESVFFSQRTRSPTGDSGGGQTNQRNAEITTTTTGLQPDELAEDQDNSQDNSESCSA